MNFLYRKLSENTRLERNFEEKNFACPPYLQDEFESPPLEALQTISEMCRELRPGNATRLYHGADVQTIV